MRICWTATFGRSHGQEVLQTVYNTSFNISSAVISVEEGVGRAFLEGDLQQIARES